jgi:hypothetical protein
MVRRRDGTQEGCVSESRILSILFILSNIFLPMHQDARD